MKFIALFILLIFGIPELAHSQEPGFINDPDGYTNIRKNESSKSEIIGKILDGERFLYYPISNKDWWNVEFIKEGTPLTGYVHKSRIKSEYQIGYNSGLAFKKIYHEFHSTASSFRTVKRNISTDDLPEYYYIETIDNKGRVVDIKFFQGSKIITNRLCYLSPWIKYEYPDSQTIISYNLNYDGSKLSSIGCDMWYKSVYSLSEDQKKILVTKIEYAIDTASLIEYGWKEDDLKQALERLKNEEQPQPIMIDGFEKSTARLNGKFPISDRFELKSFSYTGLEYEELKKILE